jgi:serine/threonine-protein kinase
VIPAARERIAYDVAVPAAPDARRASRARSSAVSADVEQARKLNNLRRARIILAVMVLVHAGWAVAMTGLTVTPGGEAQWRDGLVRIHLVATGVSALLAALLHFGDGSRALAPIRDRAGELFALYALTTGTAMAINTLSHDFGVSAWIIAVMLTSVAIHLRITTAAVLYLAAITAVSIAALAASPVIGMRVRLLSNVTAAGGLAFIMSRLLYNAFVREQSARSAIEHLNQDLERRVADQVGEIVEHAERIEALNRQLAGQVQARSLELTAALARLAAQHGEDTLRAGSVLADRFEIRRLLGVGGMGVVYAAFDRLARADVAVKLVHGNVAGVASAYRFLQEASAAAGLSHPAIVRVLHVDVNAEGRLFQVQELVDGRTLDSWTALHQPLPLAVVARLGEVLADALACAHEAGVVHRDVKPQNVMVTVAAPGCRLLDFGLAKLRRSLVHSDLSEAGTVIGTPQFLSPEQIAEPDTVTGASDIYALGMVLYLCAAGRLPFEATAPIQWLHAHLHDAPAPLPALAGVEAPIMACLAKQPADRPSARALHAAFAGLATALAAEPLVTWAARDIDTATRRLTGASAA